MQVRLATRLKAQSNQFRMVADFQILILVHQAYRLHLRNQCMQVCRFVDLYQSLAVLSANLKSKCKLVLSSWLYPSPGILLVDLAWAILSLWLASRLFRVSAFSKVTQAQNRSRPAFSSLKSQAQLIVTSALCQINRLEKYVQPYQAKDPQNILIGYRCSSARQEQYRRCGPRTPSLVQWLFGWSVVVRYRLHLLGTVLGRHIVLGVGTLQVQLELVCSRMLGYAFLLNLNLFLILWTFLWKTSWEDWGPLLQQALSLRWRFAILQMLYFCYKMANLGLCQPSSACVMYSNFTF